MTKRMLFAVNDDDDSKNGTDFFILFNCLKHVLKLSAFPPFFSLVRRGERRKKFPASFDIFFILVQRGVDVVDVIKTDSLFLCIG